MPSPEPKEKPEQELGKTSTTIITTLTTSNSSDTAPALATNNDVSDPSIIDSMLYGDQYKDLRPMIKKYLQYEKVVHHRQFIEKLIQESDLNQLTRLVGKRLTFGTAGIRGSMGPGFGQMNDLVLIQTSQGLASYLLELDSKAIREQGVIIGHDARHNSTRFARLSALAFLQKGIPVYYCDHIIPTPLIAFGVKYYGCLAGVVVTASHNPKNDNGYKVYWSNGAQILSPHDRKIQEHIVMDSNQAPWPLAWQHELLSQNSTSSLPKGWDDLLVRVHGDLSKNYFNYIETLVGERRQANKSSDICITYTAMHGVGHLYLSRALDIAGFEDIFPVESQKKPDPEFSTVKFPNPEEAGALDLAFETAKHANSNLILANDPDADRCGAALYDPKSGRKRVLNGNEIGALLGWWRWHCYLAEGSKQDFAPTGSPAPNGVLESSSGTAVATISSASSVGEENADDSNNDQQEKPSSAGSSLSRRKPDDCYMLSTTVSSKFLQSMAKVEGFKFEETLTGFKYMGNLTDELIKKHDKCVLFAFEEAIGYMVDSSILDKDGISAAVQLAQCAAYVSVNYNRRNLEQQLDWLYSVYGYHYSLNSYFICSDQAIIKEIFSSLQANYPTQFGEQFKVSRVRDLNNGFDSGQPDKKATFPCSSSSYMVTFFIDQSDITFTIRTSGTEPKIKYYSEIIAKLPPVNASAGNNDDDDDNASIESPGNNFNGPSQLAAKEAARNKLQQFVKLAIEQCLKPSHYDLEPAD